MFRLKMACDRNYVSIMVSSVQGGKYILTFCNVTAQTHAWDIFEGRPTMWKHFKM